MNTYTFSYLTIGGVDNTMDLTVDMDLTARTIDNLVINKIDSTKTQTIRLSDINVMNIPSGVLGDVEFTLLRIYQRGISNITDKFKLTISDDITDRTATGGASAEVFWNSVWATKYEYSIKTVESGDYMLYKLVCSIQDYKDLLDELNVYETSETKKFM